jgi:hypothetical protein
MVTIRGDRERIMIGTELICQRQTSMGQAAEGNSGDMYIRQLGVDHACLLC